MNKMTEGHTVKSYNDEMEQLHQLVLTMGELVQQQLRSAVQSLEDEDTEAAQAVIERDQEVNALDIDADDELVHIIAKRQPLAKDLREILTVGKIVSDLERMGDQARWVARLTIHLYDGDKNPPPHQLLSDITKMSNYVLVMAGKSITAFDELDLNEALEVLHMDVELENEFKSALRRLSTYIMEDARNVGHAADATLGLRALERFGGHAKNIAGYVVFLVKGKDVRHENLETVAAEVSS